MSDPKQPLTHDDVLAADIPDWRLLPDGLYARFQTGSFVAGTALVDRICEAAEQVDHHPDVDLRYPHVQVRLISHDVGAVTARDTALARTISELAAGTEVTTHRISTWALALDTPAPETIKPFWLAVLGHHDAGGGDLVDKSAHNPLFWLQQSEAHETPRMRFHLDVHVPHDQVQARMDQAIEAGGRLVTDEFAPSWWVLADPEGNYACLCTQQAR